MGLDMYLTGRKFFAFNSDKRHEEGFEVEEIRVKLGYWRKHANLHGYIVQQFAGGEDNCQDIELGMEQLQQLLLAVKQPGALLPKTTGFFFGESADDDEQIKEDTAIFERAVAFLAYEAMAKDNAWRSVVYRASW